MYPEDSAADAATLERLLDTQDKGLVLAGCALFRGVPQEIVEQAARAADLATAYKGQTLTEEGEPAHEIIVLVRGRVDLRVEAISPNMEVSIAKLAAGEMLGETALLDDEAHWHVTAVATEPSVLLKVPAAFVESLCEESPAIGCLIYRNAAELLASRLRRANQRLLAHMRRMRY